MGTNSKYFVVRTPSVLDIREVFTLGLGSKRGVEGKIGHKGSGLKFTLALLHRLGSNMSIAIPSGLFRSVTSEADVRGVQHSFIRLQGSLDIDTHITTSAGEDTWGTTAWYALRELVQNAVDEGGTYGVESSVPEYSGVGTLFVVPLVSSLEVAWNERESWMHERCKEVIYSSRNGDTGLFYYGFKVYTPEISNPWTYCYDVSDILGRDKLSEDRQARNVDFDQLFKQCLQQGIAPNSLYKHFASACGVDAKDDCLTTDVMKLANAAYIGSRTNARNEANFSLVKMEKALEDAYGKRIAIRGSSDTKADYYIKAAGYTAIAPKYYYLRCLVENYCSNVKKADAVLPALSQRMERVKEVSAEVAGKLREAIALTSALRPATCTIRVVRASGGEDFNAVACVDMKTREVLIKEDHINSSDCEELCDTLVHEYMHIQSNGGDCTTEFEQGLVRMLTKYVVKEARRGFKGDSEKGVF